MSRLESAEDLVKPFCSFLRDTLDFEPDSALLISSWSAFFISSAPLMVPSFAFFARSFIAVLARVFIPSSASLIFLTVFSMRVLSFLNTFSSRRF